MLGFFMQGSPARFFTDYPTLLAKRASNHSPSPSPARLCRLLPKGRKNLGKNNPAL